MEVLYPRCAGLDVHAKTVVACVRLASGTTVAYEHRTVSTNTRGLIELADWLTAQGVTHVAMEATGVYWKLVRHVLENHVTLMLANAMHIRNIPGRKSDKNDATWIADLLALGLIRSSFVPPAPIQELRDLTRTRKQFVRERARHMQRIQKTLEDANVKLTEVITDILGTSGRAILTALVAGETDPERLADLTSTRLKATRAQLVEALHGRVTAHHRFILNLHLTHIAALDSAVADVETRIREALAPFRAAVNLLTTMPGVSETAAAVILGEIGDDMAKFPSAGQTTETSTTARSANRIQPAGRISLPVCSIYVSAGIPSSRAWGSLKIRRKHPSQTPAWRTTKKKSLGLRPTILDVPAHMDCAAVELPDPETPVGARGIGEPPVAAGCCAVLNAISAAVGDEVFVRAPVTLDHIVTALELGRPTQARLTANV